MFENVEDDLCTECHLICRHDRTGMRHQVREPRGMRHETPGKVVRSIASQSTVRQNKDPIYDVSCLAYLDLYALPPSCILFPCLAWPKGCYARPCCQPCAGCHVLGAVCGIPWAMCGVQDADPYLAWPCAVLLGSATSCLPCLALSGSVLGLARPGSALTLRMR